MTESIRPFYADWAGYNRRTVEGLGALSPDDLALRAPGSDHWPICAIASHMLRLINHEAYHLGEINLALGTNGRETIDLWPWEDWAANAPSHRREGG